ncbi:protoheme IX farnesyltransferase [Pseudoclavibacter chungangensis]|nr:heme o synthase [Pseudoclavibacter chungangensis]NYJ66632.1 protoheme IX farnesyltransferase [Pseudoclavibacter chungangensis]
MSVDEVLGTHRAVERPRAARRLRAYIALTKPRIIELLLVTTAPTMILAQRGIPDLWLLAGVVFGGALAAGSANAFNCYIDRDIDRLMKRTENRPLVTGELSDREALVFAYVLGVIATAVLWLVANPLTAALAVGAILLYVVLYTLILKRRTEQNIVWGGVAGCMPVLIGWAGVTNSLSWEPFILFMVIFLWTPAHYWPLSVKYREDYDAAGVPMLSVTEGETSVSLQTVLYAWATVMCSLLLVPVAPMGWVYTTVAVLAGGWFVWESHVLYARTISGRDPKPMRVFHLSITYLTLLFLAVGIDPLVPLPIIG